MLRALGILSLLLASPIAYGATVKQLVNVFLRELVNPLIIVLFAIAGLYFLWGVVEFISKADSDEGRNEGRQKIIWGIVGLVIMVSVFGIINILSNFILGVESGGGSSGFGRDWFEEYDPYVPDRTLGPLE